jgi:hypothetical protein
LKESEFSKTAKQMDCKKPIGPNISCNNLRKRAEKGKTPAACGRRAVDAGQKPGLARLKKSCNPASPDCLGVLRIVFG